MSVREEPERMATATTTNSNTNGNGGQARRSQVIHRSRSQGRSLNPNELLLAKKQQLLSADQQQQQNSSTLIGAISGNWSPSRSSSPPLTASQDDLSTGNGFNPLHRRSQVRRAQQLLTTTSTGSSRGDSKSPDQNNGSANVEAKLESLSELLKSHHQHQQQGGDDQDGNGKSLSASKSIENVYILLAKKEKDLQLAAELGKVLLEKNDQLSKANERITEDYSRKLELLEQDKHKLKRKLDQLDGEYENRLIELQTDCNILKNQLEEQKQLSKQKEKEKSKLIDDLVQQNQRLTSELVEATKSEELLSSQLEQMNERFNVGFSNRKDHVAQLDTLKEEIQIVNQRKQDLERRLKAAQNDKSNLQALLEESGDKLLLLENLIIERDSNLSELLDELSELKDSTNWLSSELESMINLNEKLASNESSSTNSISNNFDGTGSLEMVRKKRSQLLDKLKELRLRKQSRLKASEFIIMNRQQASRAASGANVAAQRRPRNTKRVAGEQRRLKDGSLFEEMNDSMSRLSPTGSSSAPDEEEDYQRQQNEASDRMEFSDEILIEIYSQLKRFQNDLQIRKESFNNQNNNSNSNSSSNVHLNQHLYSPNSTDDSGISGDDIDKPVVRIGSASDQLDDPASWRRLLDSLKSLIEGMPCSTCYLMIGERADYEQLQKRQTKLCDQFKRKEDETLKLSALKLELEAKLVALEEKYSLLSNDLNNCDKPKEEIVKLAWKARDEAVERKNAAEISLAKSRIENMQISSQLMEVVQQKGELSQKLAQFEDDIHYITQDSVKAKFTWEEYAEKLRRTAKQQPDSNNTSNNGAASGSSLNPLAQFLNFSSNVVASTTTTLSSGNKTNQTTTMTVMNNNNTGIKPTMDNLGNQSSNLMRTFTSNRFNLKFWQKNSAAAAAASAVNDGDKKQQQVVSNDARGGDNDLRLDQRSNADNPETANNVINQPTIAAGGNG